jgi:hypothetical protein
MFLSDIAELRRFSEVLVPGGIEVKARGKSNHNAISGYRRGNFELQMERKDGPAAASSPSPSATLAWVVWIDDNGLECLEVHRCSNG